MSQFEVLEIIFNSETPISKNKIKSKIDLHPSSIEAGINDCVRKGHIKKTDRGYETVEKFNHEKLEAIRPKTISELSDDK